MAEYDQLLGVFHGGGVTGSELLCGRGVYWGGMDALSTSGNSARHPRLRGGYFTDARVAGGLYYWFHHGWSQLRRHDFTSANTRHDANANAADGLGYFCRHSPRALCVSRSLRECHHDVARCFIGNQLLYARHYDNGQRGRSRRWKSAPVPTLVLVLWTPRGVYRCATSLWDRI